MMTSEIKHGTLRHCTHWIDGKPWTGQGRVTGDIYNPATGQIERKSSWLVKVDDYVFGCGIYKP